MIYNLIVLEFFLILITMVLYKKFYRIEIEKN